MFPHRKLPPVLSGFFLSADSADGHSPAPVSFSRRRALGFTVTKARVTALNLAVARVHGVCTRRVGEGRQIVRCSHIAQRACPRLVILHCSSTSIFKSAPPPPCPFLPATIRPLFTTFSCGNLPLQKPSPTRLSSLRGSARFSSISSRSLHPCPFQGTIEDRSVDSPLPLYSLEPRSSSFNPDRVQRDDPPRVDVAGASDQDEHR